MSDAKNYFPAPKGYNFPKVVTLMGRLDLGATGSIATTTIFPGASFARTGTGAYSMTFQDSFYGTPVVNFQAQGSMPTLANLGNLGGVDVILTACDLTSATKALTFQCLGYAGLGSAMSTLDPASGNSIYIAINVADSVF